jgi:hypothetical protein
MTRDPVKIAIKERHRLLKKKVKIEKVKKVSREYQTEEKPFARETTIDEFATEEKMP